MNRRTSPSYSLSAPWRNFALLLMSALIAGCAREPYRELTVRTWGMPGDGAVEQHDYPELSDSDTYGVVRKRSGAERELVGFAFSGGGTRSASATLGQLRALHELGWLSEADYLSAVSGGSWTVIASAGKIRDGLQLDRSRFRVLHGPVDGMCGKAGAE